MRKIIFEGKNDVGNELTNNGISIESLRSEYGIMHGTYLGELFSDNHFLLCSDDSGTPCLTRREYQKVLDEIKNILPDKNYTFVENYLNNRCKIYYSARRGECRALRGESYYRMVGELNNDILFRRLKEDLEVDARLYNFVAYRHEKLPRELYFVIIEHVKNSLFRVMYAYAEKSVKNSDFFNKDEWYTLDSIAKVLWEMLIRVTLDDYFLQTQISFSRMFKIIEKLHDQDFRKVRELDSAKTLFRISHIFHSKNPKFDFCLPLFYGGIEMAYAFHAYSVVNNRDGFREIIPVVFSSNRVRKGIISNDIIDEEGLLKEEGFGKVVPEYFKEKMIKNKEASMLLVDNNITTGVSIKMFAESLRKSGFSCEMLVAEVNIQEIIDICEGTVDNKDKKVVIRGAELFCTPVGEYVTCFGVDNNSRVVNRIKFIIGRGNNTQIEGYDFDGTMFETGKVHRNSWNAALLDMGIDFDVIKLPSNSGLTFKKAAENIYNNLVASGIISGVDEKNFVEKLIDKKLSAMLEFPMKEILAKAKVINIIKADVSNTKVVITNNSLSFVLKCLTEKNLLKYFDYLICNDFAYCTKTEEKVVLLGKKKPSIDAYIEASTYFELPEIQRYYGDDDTIDREFAYKLGCNFTLI